MRTMAWVGLGAARMRAAHVQPTPVGGRGQNERAAVLADKGVLAGTGKGL